MKHRKRKKREKVNMRMRVRGFAQAAGEFLLILIATNPGKIVRYSAPEVLAMGLS